MSQFKGTHRRRATFVRTNENVRNVVLSSTLRGQKQQVRHATTVHISYPEIIFFILIITQSAKRHGSPSCSSRERQHEPARRPVRPSALAKNDVLTAAPCALFDRADVARQSADEKRNARALARILSSSYLISILVLLQQLQKRVVF